MSRQVAALVLAAAAVGALGEDESIHVAFCAECKPDMDWKSAALFHSWHTSGMRGRITRLLACNEEQLAKYPKAALEMGPTYVHRNYRTHPRVPNDHSGSYNKAASIMHFMQDVHFEETFVLYLDADMLIRRPLLPSALGATRGTVVSEHVMYLENGVNNGLVEQFSPSAPGKPAPVGWYHLFHRDDISKIAPLWLHYCERMRTEPERYWSQFGKIPRDIPTGDSFVRPGGIPWIAEMYGYVIAAAEVGVTHILTHGAVKYAEWPDDHRQRPDWIADPYILHNGIGCSVAGGYRFDKGTVHVDPARACDGDLADEGWRLSPARYAQRPPDFESAPGVERPYKEQLCIWGANMLNNALCGLYRALCAKHSPPGLPHNEECPVQYVTAAGLPATASDVKGGGAACADRNAKECPGWAHDGECRRNAAFMAAECARSCGACGAIPPLDRSPERTFNGSLGEHVIAAKADAPREAAAPHAPKVVAQVAQAAQAAQAAQQAQAAQHAQAAQQAQAAQPAQAVAAAEVAGGAPRAEAAGAAANGARSDGGGASGGANRVADGAVGGGGGGGGAARADGGAAPAAPIGGALGALQAAQLARLRARDATTHKRLVAEAAARAQVAASAARAEPLPAAAVKAAATAAAGASDARRAPTGGAAAGAAEVDGAVSRIRQQMAITWGGALLCVGCCLCARVFIVALRRRSRDRKKRDFTSKHSV
ncbi:hypothetical protein KFE25_005154 [Diacronema lutheri]|uniref:ShKT domain-containing protein n=3 Tax=Diacronema lutheri TaxID=2081491 RepID=A0A8J5X8D8_DIALT|nr:hypothetical protein KFE25_005154 [Diacronema lutheri]